jgi:glycosyltransferase involved in cell wall biosynthesis
MRIGVDGSNLREGGGRTHLVQLLAAADPPAQGVERVVVWGARSLLDLLPDRPWLDRVHQGDLERGGLARSRWQLLSLARLAGGSIDLLFSPGGTYLGSFRPFVTMFRNMLPFDALERARYGHSPRRFKLAVLHRAQAASFGRADGVIFLNDYARARIMSEVRLRGRHAVIPHGLDARFFRGGPAVQAPVSADRPLRWLYVSAIHRYKYHPNVVAATAMLRENGIPVSLDIVGPPAADAVGELNAALGRFDPDRRFVRVRPALAHHELPSVYAEADAFVFASTCENMPNTLLEAMAAALPIVCSNREPMPTILGDGGHYFDPADPRSIAAAMTALSLDPDLRATLAGRARARAAAYDWASCARDTFRFLAQVGAGQPAPRPHVVMADRSS